MLQRIQTLYLLLVVILSCIMLFMPLGGLFNKTEALEYVLNFKGIYLIQPTGETLITSVWGLTVLMALVPIISLTTIFLFKKRILQVRLLFFNIVLMAGFYALLFVYLLTAAKAFEADWFLRFVTAFPLVNIILSLLAVRAIAKDEALVKSLNRLR